MKILDKHNNEEFFKETDASKIVEAISHKNEAEKRVVSMQPSTEFGVKTDPLEPTVEPEDD